MSNPITTTEAFVVGAVAGVAATYLVAGPVSSIDIELEHTHVVRGQPARRWL